MDGNEIPDKSSWLAMKSFRCLLWRKWCKDYREGGAATLKPKLKSRSKGGFSSGKKTGGEDGLERRVRRLEAENAKLVLHFYMGWQYQHEIWQRRPKETDIISHVNCLDNAAVEQAFGHLKGSFSGEENGIVLKTSKDLNEYVIYWNTRRRQVNLERLTPDEFRNQSLVA